MFADRALFIAAIAVTAGFIVIGHGTPDQSTKVAQTRSCSLECRGGNAYRVCRVGASIVSAQPDHAHDIACRRINQPRKR